MPIKLPGMHHQLEFSKKEVIKQLDRILSSDLFSHSAMLSYFLKFIVEETLEGKTSGLKEYTIGVSALGKNADFNPQIDAIVRIHAGRLRRLLNEYYTGPGLNDPIMIEVVKGTYVPVFRSQQVDKPVSKKNENNVNVEPAQYSRSKLTLAVLPFRNLCPDNTYQFFADGLGEELTSIFCTCQDIAVIAHHSTRKFDTVPADMRSIGAELGTHYLINGTVRRTFEEIRISVNLAETMNSTQIWSKSYNHALNIENLLDIQDQIIGDIFSILGGYYGFIIRDSMTSARKKYVPDMQSFDAALWNYYFHMNFSQETYLKTRQALEKALHHEPNNAMSLAMLAELYLDSYVLGYPTVKDPVYEAYQLVQKAVRLDAHCQHAYLIFAWANIHMKRKEDALYALDRCLELNPSVVAMTGSVGFGMACAGEYQRAHALLLQAINLNPYCPWWYHLGFFFVYYKNHQYQEALDHANKIDAPDVFLSYLTKLAAKGQLGSIAEAHAEIQILTTSFSQIVENLKMYLGFFVLDAALIDEIIQGTKKAGLSVG
jgi:adenylate cyclase